MLLTQKGYVGCQALPAWGMYFVRTRACVLGEGVLVGVCM